MPRRSEGHLERYKLERPAMLLPKLVAYLEAAGATTVTSELSIEWARPPERARPNYWAARLAVARGFARYLKAIDWRSVSRKCR